MTTQKTLVADLETIAPNDSPVVSLQNISVSAVLPPILDQQSHGQRSGVLAGHRIVVRANGNGNVLVLDSHRSLVATVDSGASKSFTAEGNEVGNSWIVQ
jgi:hypothetical protein